MHLFPRWGKYEIRQELDVLDGQTSKVHTLVKVPLDELAAWDASHDVSGQRINHGEGGVRLRKEE